MPHIIARKPKFLPVGYNLGANWLDPAHPMRYAIQYNGHNRQHEYLFAHRVRGFNVSTRARGGRASAHPLARGKPLPDASLPVTCA